MRLLTLPNEKDYTPELGRLCMSGTIRCAKCGKSREGYKCHSCGEFKCYIKLYWRISPDEEGHDYQYRHQPGTKTPLGYFEAERLLNNLRSEIDDHKSGRSTFDPTRYIDAKIKELRMCVVVDKWMSDNKDRVNKHELSPGSYDTYDSYRRTHWNSSLKDITGRSFSLRDRDVRDITAKDIKKFKNLLNVNLTYKRKILNALRTFFRWMHREGYIESVPPFPTITGAEPKKMKAITRASQEIHLELIPERHRDVIAFAFETGIREGELAAIKVKDIDAESWIFTVRHNYSSGNILRETTKGGHEDDIPLSQTAIEIVKRHVSDKLPEAFLFMNPITGRGYLPQMIYKIWKSTGSPVNFHEAARHSFATQLARSGATPQQIQTLCRHRDIRTTMKYVHMDLSDLRELVNNRGDVVSLDSVKKEKKPC